MRFRINIGLEWSSGWVVTRITPARIYHYKPEYDGVNRFARRMRRSEWEAQIRSRQIVVTDRAIAEHLPKEQP